MGLYHRLPYEAQLPVMHPPTITCVMRADTVGEFAEEQAAEDEAAAS